METQTENTKVVTENQEDGQEYIPLHKSYCRECGSMISAKAVTCPKCGAAQNQATARQDEASAGLKVLSFLFPLIGLILFCVYSQNTPDAAKEYGKWALIGFVTGIVLVIIWQIVIVSSTTSMINSILNI